MSDNSRPMVDLFGDQVVEGVRRSAVFSPCRRFRYTLERHWGPEPPAVFILLNPSTADAQVDDPTNRRGIRFARDWGWGGCIFVNLFAYRTPHPEELKRMINIEGPDNLETIEAVVRESGFTVCAWGNHGRHLEQDRRVLRLLKAMKVSFFHMGLTKQGCPKHILYLRADTEPVPWAHVEGRAI